MKTSWVRVTVLVFVATLGGLGHAQWNSSEVTEFFDALPNPSVRDMNVERNCHVYAAIGGFLGSDVAHCATLYNYHFTYPGSDATANDVREKIRYIENAVPNGWERTMDWTFEANLINGSGWYTFFEHRNYEPVMVLFTFGEANGSYIGGSVIVAYNLE